MCLIFVAWRMHPDYPLLAAANRDEAHARETQTAHWWQPVGGAPGPRLLAGRDLRSGGSWMGVSSNGRFAAVTNFSAPASDATLTSRGQLVTDWLSATNDVDAALQALPQHAAAYNPFSLLLADGSALGYGSNQEIDQRRRLPPGIYGLGNHRLDSPWPKISSGKQLLKEWLNGNADSAPRPSSPTAAARVDWLLEMMRSEAGAEGGIGADRQQSRFVRHPLYGTRCTTVLLLGADGNALFHERSFAPSGAVTADKRYTF